ncbi:MAG TPA: DUF6364 family protein [Gracilimonas sp.]|uniref:DUF6364 family protein n=1 Tax=Gracilimonas sp. TaxID=1974203 RepID=UPI002DA501BE|nr:DUF6364 family protein [Gracilimonas sp.]
MKSKLTLSIEGEVIKQAKELAKKNDSTVSQMFTDFVESQKKMQKKLTALNKISGSITANVAAEGGEDYGDHLHKKHGWE